MKRKKHHLWLWLLAALLLHLALHATPTVAIRTHVFFDGHFLDALTIPIEEGSIYNNVETAPAQLKKANAQLYSFTKAKKGEKNPKIFYIVDEGLHYYHAFDFDDGHLAYINDI